MSRAGPHSLAVSLPKSWLDHHGLGRGDTVWLGIREDGRIEIEPSEPSGAGSVPGPVLTVHSGHFEDPDVLARTIFGAYVVGYERILLSDEAGFDPDCRSKVEAATRSLLGLQLVVSDDHVITLQSFLDPRRDTIPKIVARSGAVVDEMAVLLSQAVRGETPVPVDRLREREMDADRLYALTLRQLMLAQQDPGLARALEVAESRDLLGNRVVAKVLEEMTDLLFRAGPELRTGASGRTIPGALRSNLLNHLEGFRSMVRDSLRALRTGDNEGAHRVLQERDRSVDTFRATESLLARARLPRRQTAALAVFAWGLGSAAHLCGTIAEVALNASLRSTGPIPPGERSSPRTDGGAPGSATEPASG
ncbi:MAG: AbrB/MazE/SpoVT family DNA-binding domain-containing protein [Thermoplasmata archaeon]